MSTVQAQAIMSLDGYVAKEDNTIGRLFDWLQNGEVNGQPLSHRTQSSSVWIVPESKAELTRGQECVCLVEHRTRKHFRNRNGRFSL